MSTISASESSVGGATAQVGFTSGPAHQLRSGPPSPRRVGQRRASANLSRGACSSTQSCRRCLVPRWRMKRLRRRRSGADVTGGKRGAAGRAGASRGRQRIGWARTSGLCARSESPVTYLSESPRVPRRRYLEVYCCVRYLYIALLFGALGQQLTALFLVGLCC